MHNYGSVKIISVRTSDQCVFVRPCVCVHVCVHVGVCAKDEPTNVPTCLLRVLGVAEA